MDANAHQRGFAKAAGSSKHQLATDTDGQVVLRRVEKSTKSCMHAFRLMRKQVQRAVPTQLVRADTSAIQQTWLRSGA